HEDLLAFQSERRPQRMADSCRYGEHVACRSHVLDEHREFISAKPRYHVTATRRVQQPLGSGNQQTVALLMTERVVYGLEVVEIEEQDCDRVRIRFGALERLDDTFLKARPVGEIRERIVIRLVRQPL